ncbi:MAG: hypothetical protein EOM26_09555 [Alphaproteobacteria bacterium]|nr:hypothetical protein [Alphaproteobacteria bacterium]
MRVTGFVEGRTGTRYQDSPYHKDVSLLETRAQFQFDKSFETIHARLTADLLYDAVDDDHAPDLEHGEGWLDLREASIVARPADFMDVKVGRQILTWGTGDLIFVNDMFPKDWVSFFTGRDVEYLKAPSDALKVSMFSELANLDVIYTPQFDPDRYISGERISFYSGNSGRIAGENHEIVTHPRNEWIDDSETAFRLYRTFGSVETALYAYSGYWKSPAGQTASGIATFPALDVYGASMRGTVYKGIGNLELGYYDSREDDSGTDPLIRNSELRFLAGYEQELVPNLTGGVQYYLERMMDYDAYRANLAPGAVQKDKNRHMVTVRLTRLAMNQNLELSLFNFWSPSDRDGYLRPNVTYKMTDRWTVSGGANIFYGKRRDTFWGQFEDNSNVYGALRYSF